MPAMLSQMPLPAAPSYSPSRRQAIRYRVGQFARQLLPLSGRESDSALAVLLPPEQLTLVMRLDPADRRHLLAVHRALVAEGWTDPDLLTAALLHDIGKADSGGRVSTAHRVMKVLIQACAPETLARLARHGGSWIRHGLYLSLHHASIGADLARKASVSDRACWLIAHHDDGRITGDPALHALRARDARE